MVKVNLKTGIFRLFYTTAIWHMYIYIYIYFFNVDHFLKSLLNLLQYCFSFMF